MHASLSPCMVAMVVFMQLSILKHGGCHMAVPEYLTKEKCLPGFQANKRRVKAIQFQWNFALTRFLAQVHYIMMFKILHEFLFLLDFLNVSSEIHLPHMLTGTSHMLSRKRWKFGQKRRQWVHRHLPLCCPPGTHITENTLSALTLQISGAFALHSTNP